MKSIVSGLVFFIGFFSTSLVEAQCAMCRTQIVNNVSNGDTSLAAGLNTGIMYLFFTPYLMIAVIAILWFRYSKINEPKENILSRIRRQMS